MSNMVTEVSIGEYKLRGRLLIGPCNCDTLGAEFLGRKPCRSHEYYLSVDEMRRVQKFTLNRPYLTDIEKSENLRVMLFGREPDIQG